MFLFSQGKISQFIYTFRRAELKITPTPTLTPTPEIEDIEEYIYQECRKVLKENIAGSRWRYMGFDDEYRPELTLFSDGDFQMLNLTNNKIFETGK